MSTCGEPITLVPCSSVSAALTLKTDGTRPILVDKYKYLTVNGEEYAYASNGYGNNIVTDGSTVRGAGMVRSICRIGVAVKVSVSLPVRVILPLGTVKCPP